MHSIISKGIDHWSSRNEDALEIVAETLRDLHITIPGCKQPVHPRSASEMGGAIPEGMTVVDLLAKIDAETDHSFLRQRTKHFPNCHERIQKKALL
jgi:hypothetical protein